MFLSFYPWVFCGVRVADQDHHDIAEILLKVALLDTFIGKVTFTRYVHRQTNIH